ncbi:MAG TPA: GAF domain-containing protein [Chloroflexia bacterium]|nr:GAF domain-containing protein [Chloroflexia bacterium]
MNAEEQNEELERARREAARQVEEIARLKRQLEGQQAAADLYRTFSLVGIVGSIASPGQHNRLLEEIVQTAMQVISAKAGALFLIDREAEDLIFQVALGGKADQIKKFRVPLGHGIAGLVAVSGQPMAITNAQEDSRQASDIAESVNYIPSTILCVPLFYGDEVIGVLELLDKQGAPAFSPADIDLLGMFAKQAATAIEHSRINTSLQALIGDLFARHAGGAGANNLAQAAQRQAADMVATIEQMPEFDRALELARLVQQITADSEEGYQLCKTVLSGVADYLKSRNL